MRDPFVERLRHLYETSRAELYMYALSMSKHLRPAEDSSPDGSPVPCATLLELRLDFRQLSSAICGRIFPHRTGPVSTKQRTNL